MLVNARHVLRFVLLAILSARLVGCTSSLETPPEEAIVPADTADDLSAELPTEAPSAPEVDPVVQEVLDNASSPDFTDPNQVGLSEDTPPSDAEIDPDLTSTLVQDPATPGSQEEAPLDSSVVESPESTEPQLDTMPQLNATQVLFGKSRTKVAAAYRGTLRDIAAKMKENRSLKILIEGHSDVRGSAAFNRQLALQRAQSVQRFLQQHGVRNSQMKVVSHGKDKPLAFGDTEADHAQNRRVEVTFR